MLMILVVIPVKCKLFRMVRYSIVKIQLNKKYRNTILLDGSIAEKELFSWIDHSYDQVLLNLKGTKPSKGHYS